MTHTHMEQNQTTVFREMKGVRAAGGKFMLEYI